MISWAGRESLTISNFSSLTCDQAVLRFSHFLWEAWSQVISIFATSNVNKNRFHCLIECHINTIIYKQKRNNIVSHLLQWERRQEVSMHRLAISSTCGYLFDSVHNYGKSSIIYTAECAIISYWCNQTKRSECKYFLTLARNSMSSH